jgi:peptide/nickel transport system substrate-binding protein
LKNSSAHEFLQIIAYQNASFVQSKKAFKALGEKGFKRRPIGTSPYQFDRWFPGEKVVLKKFDKYWGGPPALDGIEIWIIPENVIALGQLEKGDLDVVCVVDPGSWEAAKGIKGAYIISNASPQLQKLYLNNKVKPLDDVRVRRALAHALDLKALCSHIGTPANNSPSPFPPPVVASTNEFWRYEYNLEKAKKLLAEAGYPNGFELTMIYKKQGIFEHIALEAKNMWDKIVDVKLQRIDKALYSKTVRKYKQHVAVWSLTRYSPFSNAERYMTGNKRNYSQYSNPRVDEIATKARLAKTEEEARRHWRQFQKLVAEDVANIIAVNLQPMIVIKNHVKGVIPMTSNTLVLTRASME